MNRRNFLRNFVGAILIGVAQPLGKLESCLKINSGQVAEEYTRVLKTPWGLDEIQFWYTEGKDKWVYPIVKAPMPQLPKSLLEHFGDL